MLNKKVYREYLRSEQWASIRQDMIEIYNSTCQLCFKKTLTPEIHHLTYKNIFHEEPKDLMLLCPFCHKKIHGFKDKHLNQAVCKMIIERKIGKKLIKCYSWDSLAKVIAKYLGRPPLSKRKGKNYVKKNIKYFYD